MSATMTISPSAVPTESTAASEAQAIAQEAYIYLYPLILMDLTRKQFINLDPKTSPFGGPANTFTHIRAFPTADMRTVVRPNFDTLYSSAWLDLTRGPVIVSTADTGGRYFMLPMLDMWTDVFAVPGKRTNGTGAANFALVPPGLDRERCREGVERIDAPTPYVWIIGRTQTNGVEGLRSRAQGPGRLQDHAPGRLGQNAAQDRAEDRPVRRHQDGAVAAGQRDVGGSNTSSTARS